MHFITRIVLSLSLLLTLSFSYKSQIREAELSLEKNETFKQIIDLKNDGFIIKTYSEIPGNITSHLHYFDDKLNHQWSKEFSLNLSSTISPNGFPIYSMESEYNGIFSTKYITIKKLDKKGVITEKEILFSSKKERIENLLPTKDGFTLITYDFTNKGKKMNFYKIRKFNSDFDIIEEHTSSIREFPKKNKYWKEKTYKNNSIYYFKNYYKPDKKNLDQKIKVNFLVMNETGEINDVILKSSKPPLNRFAPNKSINYLFDQNTGNSYLTYLNENGNLFYIDCFDLEGELMWSKEHQFMEEPLLTNSHKYNDFSLASMDNETLGYRIMIKDHEHLYNFYLSKKTGEIVDGNNYKYKGYAIDQMSLVDNYILSQNEGKLGKVIVKKAQEIEKKKVLKKARYAYLPKDDCYILVLYADNEISITKFEK